MNAFSLASLGRYSSLVVSVKSVHYAYTLSSDEEKLVTVIVELFFLEGKSADYKNPIAVRMIRFFNCN